MDDDAEAEAYERMDHRSVNEAFMQRLMELGAHGRCIDLGCGPGHIAAALASHSTVRQVVAVDVAHTMLVRAQRRVPAGCQLMRADIKRLPFSPATFDVVFSNTVLHHIPEPADLLREAARLLKPGGVLLIRDLFRPTDDAGVQHLVQTHAADEDPVQRELFAASLRAALTPQELREQAAGAGLAPAQVVVDSDRHVSLQMARSAAEGL